MREHIFRLGTRYLAVLTAVVVATLALVVGFHTSISTAQAQEPKPTPTPESGSVSPPPGGCWNGALSGDPVFCYFLEEAQRTGEIDIVAIYEAPGGGPLFVYLRQTEHVSDQVGAFFREKAHAYLEGGEGRDTYGAHECDDLTGGERKNCLDRLLGSPSWAGFDSQIGNSPLPLSREYEKIFLYPGGAEARRTQWGWASWGQAWPSSGTRSPGTPGSSSTFDVSDVDLTNIPEPDCDEDFGNLVWNSCRAWSRQPNVGYAGARFDGQTSYAQIKNPPVEQMALDALKEQLAPGYTSYGYNVEIIPVSYDFGQLWRWNVILDRFALSAGNTVGITAGQVGINSRAYEGPLGGSLWVKDVQPVRSDDWDNIREILIVWALDPEVAAAAMDDLLPLLGIPVDAVGLVGHDDATPVRAQPLTDDVKAAVAAVSTSETENARSGAVGSTGPSTDGSRQAFEAASDRDVVARGPEAAGKVDSDADSGTAAALTWVITGGGGAIALALLGGVLFTVRRRRQHQHYEPI